MIETERLEIIGCSRMHFEAALQDEQQLASFIGVNLADDWLPFPEAITGGYMMLLEDPQNLRWGTMLFVHKPDSTLMGSGGFKGAADENGKVEIGYAIAPEYQDQGLATEAAKGMIDYAFSWSQVQMVDAHTLAETNSSTKVLEKNGLTKIGEESDTEDGNIWHWRITREEYEKNNAG